ncbi:hypothetical protein L873DRAFT_1791100 [Choiromyces venosus 120613-1]|uniref:Lytic polysaccharide monooxygenase n=1 Tax=Choiromyces venosus 120613-1 TaxID=1336337 RepID=A0A3N4JJQ6_9PEZI|nr:hypothetical protein L873DRAFT_1791100 [Choiromyces venosus 120613-1]
MLSLHLLIALPFLGSVNSHMSLLSPYPITHPDNDHRSLSTPLDPYLSHPLLKDGSNFPCRNSLKYLTPSTHAAMTWQAGSVQAFELEGTAPHYGGSCQVSLSFDEGKTFGVIKSFPGSCPHRTNGKGQRFNFTIPEAAPAGRAVFSWTWHNREQEMYMNCALVNITNTSNGPTRSPLNLPALFVADIGNGCKSPGVVELKYPDPGDQVELGDGEYVLALPSGNCGGNAKSGPVGSGPKSTPVPTTFTGSRVKTVKVTVIKTAREYDTTVAVEVLKTSTVRAVGDTTVTATVTVTVIPASTNMPMLKGVEHGGIRSSVLPDKAMDYSSEHSYKRSTLVLE